MKFNYLLPFVVFGVFCVVLSQVSFKAEAGILKWAAAAGVVYEIYEHHETEKQKNSLTRLHIRLLSGNNLLAKDHHLFSAKSSDPYVIFNQGHLAIRSDYIKRSLDPVWENQEFNIGVLDTSKDLYIEVHDHSLLGKGDSLGHAYVPLSDIGHEPQQVIVNLKGSSGLFHSNHGTLTLQLWITHL